MRSVSELGRIPHADYLTTSQLRELLINLTVDLATELDKAGEHEYLSALVTLIRIHSQQFAPDPMQPGAA